MPASTIVAGDLSGNGQPVEIIDLDGSFDRDAMYHRPVNHRQVGRITADYDTNRYQIPTLSRRAGRVWVVDGLQTLVAAKMMGYKKAVVRFVDGLSYEDEVRLYLDLNAGRRPVNALEKHKARIAMGEPIALEIEDILDSRGLALALRQKPGALVITSVGSLRYAWGAAGSARDHRVVSAQTLANGRKVLEWALDSLMPLVNKGEAADLVFSRLNLNALIWLARNAETVPAAPDMAALMAGESVVTLRKTEADFSRSARERAGTRLANHLNAKAGSVVVVLPEESDRA